MRKAISVVLSGVFIAVTISTWAVPSTGAAHFRLREASTSGEPANLPAPVTFREFEGRGLLAKAWLNGRGPFTVAIDTGAGMSLLTGAAATQAGITSVPGGSAVIAGLSGREVNATKAVIDRLALGWSGNVTSRRLAVAIAPSLPANVDGVIDPTDAFSPMGYVIDYPRKTIRAFDPNITPLDPRRAPADGVIVRWYRDGHSRRPFVKLGDGRLALLDTGSGFGLAFSRSGGFARDRSPRYSHDIGGGAIGSTRVAPTTVNIGALVLNEVPTDILDGVEKGAPVILGRDALYPFRLTFDPVRRLIEIVPADEN